MKHCIRTVSCIFALLLTASLTAACGSSDNHTVTDDTTAAPVSDTPAITEDVIRDNLPDLDFGGETVSILHFGLEQMGGHDSSDWYGDSGDIIADALYTRDMTTEERLGIKLSYAMGSDD